MTEQLGDAVLDLDANLMPLVRGLAEAKTVTRAGLSDMAGYVQGLDRLATQAGNNLQRQFLGPVASAFLTARSEAAGLEDELRSLDFAAQMVNSTLADTRSTMAQVTAAVVTGTSIQQRAIEGVRDAWLETAAAMRLASGGHAGFVSSLSSPASAPALPAYRPGMTPEPYRATSSAVYGIRGPGGGTLQNPIVNVLEAGSVVGMGSRGAQVAMNSSLASQNVNAPSASDLGSLSDSIQQLATASNAPGPTDPNMMALAITQALQHAPSRPQIAAAPVRLQIPQETGYQPNFQMIDPMFARPPRGLAPGRQPLMLAAGPQPATGAVSIDEMLGRVVAVDQQIARTDAQIEDTVSQLERILAEQALAPPGGSGDRGGRPPRPPGPPGPPRPPSPSPPPPDGFWSTLLGASFGGRFGRGLGIGPFGMGIPLLGAPAFSLASFAGLGREHFAMTGLGLAGSLAGAGIGAGLLGLGTLGTTAVGGGADAAVMKTAMTNVQNLDKAYVKLQDAVTQYGAKSSQAASAQQALNAQMRQQIADVGPKTAAMNMQVTKSLAALDSQWMHSTAVAQRYADQIMLDALQVGHTFVPLIAHAAQQNLLIVERGLDPLFAWLRGPNGIGIFMNLESIFKQHLPTAVDAFVNVVEVFLRVVNLAAGYTGHFITVLDEWARKANALSDSQLNTWIGKMIGDFRLWEQLVKNLVTDIYLLFHQDAGTAQGIVATLNQMLIRLGDWERSVQGGQRLHTIFEVHKQEILALLQLIPLFVNAIAPIYLAIAPAMTQAFTAILTVVLDLVKALEALPGGAWAVGLLAISAKLFGFGATFRAITGAVGAMTAGLAANAAGMDANAAAAARLSAANTRLAGSETAAAAAAKGEAASLAAVDTAGAGGVLMTGKGGPVPLAAASQAEKAGLGANLAALPATMFANVRARLAGLLTKVPGIEAEMAATIAGPLLAGGIGAAGGDLIQHIVPGLRHGMVATLVGGAGGGAIGAAIGSVVPGLGTMIGAGLGAALGSTFGPTVGHLLNGLFSDQAGQDWGQKFAHGFSIPMAKGLIPQQDIQHYQDELQKIGQQIFDTTHPAAQVTQLGAGAGRFTPNQLTAPTVNLQQVRSEYSHAAQVAVASFEDVFNRTPYKTEPAFLQDALLRLKAMPPQARLQAAQLIVEYAAELQRKGQLPAGSVQKIVQGIEHQFGILTVSAKYQGGLTAKQWGAAMTLDAAQKNLDTAVHNIRQDFGLAAVNAETTSKNMYTQLTITFSDLRKMMRDTSGAAHQEVKAQFEQLRSSVLSTTKDMQTKLAVDAAAMKNNLTDNSRAAEAAVTTDFNRLAGNVRFAVHEGFLAANEGTQKIAQALEGELKAFGGAHIPFPSAVQWANWAMGNQPAAPASGGPGHRATGGMMVNQPMYVVGEEAPQYPEVVLSTNPRDRAKNVGLWADAGSRLNIPGFATGGYVYPIAGGVPIGRTDQGIDPAAPAGKPFGPIGDATIKSTSIGGWPGGPFMYWQLSNGPMAGRYVYLAEEIRPTVHPGQHVSANQAIAVSTGPSQEMGWAVAGGSTLARATSGYSEGQVTPAGLAFRAFLMGLSHGKIIGGAGGLFGGFTPPHVVGHGTLTEIDQRVVDLGTTAANSKLASVMATLSPGGSGFIGSFASAGSVERQIYQTLSQKGWDKIAIAAAIGNAAQESGLNPASVGSGGGGLWGFTSGAISLGALQSAARSAGVSWTDAGFQAAFMAAHYGSVGALNAYRDPAQAALYFMNTFEKPNAALANIPHREQAAQQAYAQGYAQGGVQHATRPTVAVFGEAGPETAIFIPGNVDVVGGSGGPGFHGGPHGHHFRGVNLPGHPPHRGVPWDPGMHDWRRWGDFVNDLLWGGKDATGPMKQLHGMHIMQLDRLLKDFPHAAGHWGPATGIERHLSDAHKDLQLTLKAQKDRLDQAKKFDDEAKKATGKQHWELLHEASKAREQAADDAAHAQDIRKQIRDLQKQFNKSQPGKTLNDIRTILDKKLTEQIADLQKIAAKQDKTQQLLASVEGLAPGTNLAKLGITRRILRDVGLPVNLSPGTALGTKQVDTAIEKEIRTLRHEMRDYQIEIQNVHGKQRQALIAKVDALIGRLVSLEGAIQNNTSATNANTNSSMTGTTAFTYNGQTALASDSLLLSNVGA